MRVAPLDPRTAHVQWQAPLRPNGPLSDVTYTVMYSRQVVGAGGDSHVHVEQKSVSGSADANHVFETLVGRLAPATNYTFQVGYFKRF